MTVATQIGRFGAGLFISIGLVCYDDKAASKCKVGFVRDYMHTAHVEKCATDRDDFMAATLRLCSTCSPQTPEVLRLLS